MSAHNDHRPVVSVGLPVFNAEETLAAAITSVLDQDLHDLELVVCDNGSNDGTREIASGFSNEDDRVRYFRSETNLGAWRNFERAFELSRGVYFKWMSDDDRLAPSLLTKAVDVLERSPEVALCTWLERMVDVNGVERARYEYDQRWLIDAGNDGERFLQFLRASSEGKGDPIYGLMRRDTATRTRLLEAGLWIPNFIMMGDLAVLGPWVTIPEVLVDRGYPSGPARRGTDLSVRSVIRHFDPANGNILWPHWRFMAQHFSIVSRSDMRDPDKVALYARLVGFFGRRWRGLASDALDAVAVLRQKWSAPNGKT